MPFLPRPVSFPSVQVERLGMSFTEAPKCATVALRPPHLLPHTADFRFSSLPNLGRAFVLPLPSQRGPEKAPRSFQFDFKRLPIRCADFHRFLALTKGFLFPCSKNCRVEQR
ncbi:hypothetical protein AVEN_143997-1 [Araneus ventricosus]|uniref:Uncharacterized protein n=1 Tax=Araneus ventricosus TaxID=182803 RepID=A0A4Y2N5W8_ARAVE|nr:hypothetical protein AVEN_143997-1 [Araneus ventricosus]